ncbi:hypothetical protein [Actinoallomurus liliacearum]
MIESFGWAAIDEAPARVHGAAAFGTIHKGALGGPDPLDGYGVPAGEVIG